MKLQAVVFDWAGTLADHGSQAPVVTLLEVFERAGVPITRQEARLSMGIAKREHIRAILALPRVAEQWRRENRAAPDEADLDRLYADFVPRQLDCLGRFSNLIEGVPATAERLRSRGIKIGSTTGYTRPMLDFLLEQAGRQGFAPDCALCPEDVPGGGRPAPWMCYLNAIRLQAAPLSAMVKIGDTPSDMAEGRNAGMWTIGVTRTGNEVGLTLAEWIAAPDAPRRELLAAAQAKLLAAGANYTADSVPECFEALREIEGRLAAGERP